jgi:T4 RnlA family RNA ligase
MDQAYEALNGHDEFVVKEYDGKVSFDYQVIMPDSFSVSEKEITERAHHLWKTAGCSVSDVHQFRSQAEKEIERFANIRRNFRGVTFDIETGEMISLPLHKFFNVNQIPETQFNLLKNHDATIYEKMDGTMIHFFIYKEKLEAATCRSTFSPLAHEALQLARRNNLEDQIRRTIAEGWTPIFEYVAPTNQIVVQYSSPRIVYLISRKRETGVYHFEESFEDKAMKYEFKFSDVMSNIDIGEFEGYVCHLPNMIVKVKTPWYLERHRAVDALMRPAYKLYQVVYDGHMDDLIAIATDNYKPVLTKIYEEAQRDLLNEKKKLQVEFDHIQKEYDRIATDTQDLRQKRAEFVQVVKRLNPQNFNLIMAMHLGRDADSFLQKRLIERYREIYPQKIYASTNTKELRNEDDKSGSNQSN